MRIGVVCSGYEMMPLLQILQIYDVSYDIFMDWKMWPWGDKSYELQQERIDVGVKYLLEEVKVDKVIVPPLFEHTYISSGAHYILPLFTQYIHQEVLPYSLVGKIGLLCDSSTKEQSQTIMRELCSGYTLQANQLNTKSFHKNFPLWSKPVPMWNFFLTTFGKRDRMVRKTIKYDLGYFKDAGVDTLVPMHWGILFYETIIAKRTNRKKIRFHGKESVKRSFEKVCGISTGGTYSMTIHYTDIPQVLFDQRKWMDVLTRGGTVSIEVKKVHL